jgi:hypothetical protein
MLLRKAISQINNSLSKVFNGMKVYGLAQTAYRKTGDQQERFPQVVDLEGEGKYVGIDDTDPIIIYHRNTGLTTGRTTRQGYGDGHSDLVNTYQMAMIVFQSQELTKMFPEELFLFLQANFPEEIRFNPYKTVFIRTTNVILNSQLVFAVEYAGTDFFLPAEKSLFQINYTIESTFKKDCFAKCPEDC